MAEPILIVVYTVGYEVVLWNIGLSVGRYEIFSLLIH